jgi:hypothetical protein
MIERLLRRHFIRRFLDNDLISPDTDRHEVLATIAAIVISASLFLTMLMGLKYLTMIAQSPGRTAMGAIADRFFLYGCSMTVTAFAALLSWNALSLDARDIAILGPLPIARRTLVRAKLGAVAIVAATFAVALNAATGVLYPVFLVGNVAAGLATTALTVTVHAGISLAAGAFGFLSILAVRELLHASLGTAQFSRVSVSVHATVTVGVMVTLLLLPGMSSDPVRQWLVPLRDGRWLVPPLWFVGLHEYLAGDIITGLPFEPLPRFRFVVDHEMRAAALYAQARSAFPGLAAAAAIALPIVALLALPAYRWNNRRMDSSPAVPARRRHARLVRLAEALVEGLIARHPSARAGFWLACRCVTRSLPHRMSVGFAVAIGLAALMVGLPVAWSSKAVETIPVSSLTPQIILLVALVVSFRHAIGLSADVRSGWVFRVAWLGETRRFVTGVKRFALVGLIIPAAAVLIPIQAPLLGLRAALAQAILGSAIATVMLQISLFKCDRLPLAVPRAVTGNLKTRGPVYLVTAVALVYGLAALMRVAIQGTVAFAATLGIAAVVYLALDVRSRRQTILPSIDLDDSPDEGTQRLGLVG